MVDCQCDYSDTLIIIINLSLFFYPVIRQELTGDSSRENPSK